MKVTVLQAYHLKVTLTILTQGMLVTLTENLLVIIWDTRVIKQHVNQLVALSKTSQYQLIWDPVHAGEVKNFKVIWFLYSSFSWDDEKATALCNTASPHLGYLRELRRYYFRTTVNQLKIMHFQIFLFERWFSVMCVNRIVIFVDCWLSSKFCFVLCATIIDVDSMSCIY